MLCDAEQATPLVSDPILFYRKGYAGSLRVNLPTVADGGHEVYTRSMERNCVYPQSREIHKDGT